jgi:hypothetical protein
MNYKEIVTNVAKGIDPNSEISVEVVSDTSKEEAHFVVADINYDGEQTMRVPFVIYGDSEVFMPYDWQGALPVNAEDIENVDWVTYPNRHHAIMRGGLPRLFAGDF